MRSVAEIAQIAWNALPIFTKPTPPELYALLIREAGKTLDNAQADLREAVDFLRYYASEARAGFEAPVEMPGPTGETNQMFLRGRGVFACIAPWNFPLAIFTGQMSAALAAGNTVLAKPAEQTPLIAYEAVKLMHQAGVPNDVLSLLPGDGARIGGQVLQHARLGGVAFTGSTQTAHIINRSAGRAQRSHPASDRRNRWNERDDRRLVRLAGTSGPRPDPVGV